MCSLTAVSCLMNWVCALPWQRKLILHLPSLSLVFTCLSFVTPLSPVFISLSFVIPLSPVCVLSFVTPFHLGLPFSFVTPFTCVYLFHLLPPSPVFTSVSFVTLLSPVFTALSFVTPFHLCLPLSCVTPFTCVYLCHLLPHFTCVYLCHVLPHFTLVTPLCLSSQMDRCCWWWTEWRGSKFTEPEWTESRSVCVEASRKPRSSSSLLRTLASCPSMPG